MFVMVRVFRVQYIAWLFGVIVLTCVVAAARAEEVIKVTLCQLRKDPEVYNHKLVQVTAFVSHGFEDFSLFDPECSADQSRSDVWLEYGGVVASGTLYCCGVTANRQRPRQLVVENIPIRLIDDKVFREFDRQIHRFPNSSAHATILGRFFSDEKMKSGDSSSGYGHMACCSLLAIEQILSVDPQDRDDLDYGGPTDPPKVNVGCGYRLVRQDTSVRDVIEAQRQAELGQRAWSFNNPRRVASESLARGLNIDEKSITGIRQIRKSQGRVVYEWQSKGKRMTYTVVISRPYWLAFYASGRKRVTWIVKAFYESSCG